MKEIARRAGVSVGNLYRYYPQKEALFAAVTLPAYGMRSALIALDCLARFGLADAAHLKVAQFSKGMRMRLNVCRALLRDPELLFLDEPTSGLDPVNADAMKRQFMELRAQGKAMVLDTHNMHAAAELCDRVAVLVDGRRRLIDSPRELKLRYGNRPGRSRPDRGASLRFFRWKQ